LLEVGRLPPRGDSGAIRLPGQGVGALLRVPHGQAGLWSGIMRVAWIKIIAIRREKYLKSAWGKRYLRNRLRNHLMGQEC